MSRQEQIHKICAAVETAWNSIPEWRLGQFVQELIGERRLLQIEDSELEAAISEFIKKVANLY